MQLLTAGPTTATKDRNFTTHATGFEFKLNSCGSMGHMQQPKPTVGRPPLDVGPRHTVAVKLEMAEWEKLQAIAIAAGVLPGPHSTQILIDYIRSFDLDQIRNQEVLFDKAS